MRVFKKEPGREKEKEVCVSSPDGKEKVCSPGGNIKSVAARDTAGIKEDNGGNVFIGTLNFFAAPYRSLKESYEKKYAQARKFFILDLVLLVLVGCLAGFNIYLGISRSNGIFRGNLFGSGPGIEKNNNEAGGISETENPSLAVGIKINSQDKIFINPGETLEYAVSFRNGGDKILYDLALKINLEGAVLDFDQISSGKGVVRGRSVVWTKDQMPEFAELFPGAEGELKFKIGTVKIAEPALALEFGNTLKSLPEVFYKKESGFGESIHWAGEAREDKFNSDLAVLGIARYYTAEGDQLGRGPLPPVVGKTTKYWIFWSAENNLSDVSDVSVSAVLPSDVSWTGNVSVSLGELDYNQARRTVVWKAGQVEHYIGEDWPKQGVAFEVSLTPGPEMRGSEAVLLDKIKIFGNDNITGQFLERPGADLTTNLIYDSLAKNKSRVTEK